MATTTEPIPRSIEVEYWVIDESGRLVEPGDLVDAGPGVEREFVEPLLEVKTTPCETTAELREQLLTRLRAVLDRARESGRGLVPMGTPVTGGEITELPSDRTWVQNLVVGEDFEYVRHCAGTHVHVEQVDGRAIDQLNTFVAMDPALALVNSSPYFRGRELAAGARSKLYRWMAYDDLPHQGWLWSYVDDRAEWNRQLERRYDEFVAAAIDAGVDRHTLAANFDPESAVWTPVQLREAFGTVEWRSPDAALPSSVVGLADRLAAVSDHLRDAEVAVAGDTPEITADKVRLPSFDVVLEHVNAAIREGLTADSVRSYLTRLGFDVDAYAPVTHAIDDRGPVRDDQARRIRIEAAKRLEADVYPDDSGPQAERTAINADTQ